MKKLNKLQSIVFLLGGVLMVIGAACFSLLWQQDVVCWVFLAGAAMFSTMQLMQTYDGRSFVVQRLKRIMNLADLLFVVAGILMVDTAYQFLRSMFDSYDTYFSWLYNKWVVALLIAAVLEMYTMHRIDHELGKEEDKAE